MKLFSQTDNIAKVDKNNFRPNQRLKPFQHRIVAEILWLLCIVSFCLTLTSVFELFHAAP